MKRVATMVSLLTLFTMVAAPLTGHAAQKKAKNEVVMKVGNRVNLFHSSKVSVQKEIAVGDVLPVYRLVGKMPPKEKEVGQVKVLRLIGDHYFEAEILKGEVKVGDIAEKGGASMLVQPTD